MLPQVLEGRFRKRAGFGGSRIGLRRARYYASQESQLKRRVREAEAQSHLRQLINAGVGIVREGVHTLPNLLLAVVLEVDVTEVALGEDRVRTNFTGQAAVVKRHTGNDPDSVFLAIWE